ncbi:hypothetical protein [Mucilaginibacter sp.]|uniref:hypothetical protein n=1 Tax=Mucilaginibacter sp. TaxID=1882438 RepID=UPI0032666AA8
MQYLVITTLAIFTIASVFFQVKRLQRRLSRFDKLGILPNYSFFAPKPLMNDFRVVYKTIAETDGEWTEIPMYKPFRFMRLCWNPFKYYNKGMIDTCNFLVSEFNALENKKFIQVSAHYLNILITISACLNKGSGDPQKIRFAIISSEGAETLKIKNVVFASYHQII